MDKNIINSLGKADDLLYTGLGVLQWMARLVISFFLLGLLE